MTKSSKVLVFTDHKSHSQENSLYDLLLALREQSACSGIDVASRSIPENDSFFKDLQGAQVFVTQVKADFAFSVEATAFHNEKKRVDIREYDAILLRLPHPIQEGFWDHLVSIFPERKIINQPGGIKVSSNKSFLLEVRKWCPPISLCERKADVLAFAQKFPIVLKPLEGYGGAGIVKVTDGRAWLGNQEIDWQVFLQKMETEGRKFLAMKYLKNVDQGDKRIVVINGKVIGASLRMPPEGSWLCNASQGGKSVVTELTKEEEKMATALTKKLREIGVLFFGFDTLVDDAGKRVLSEINTLSIGGIRQMGQQRPEKPILAIAAEEIMKIIKTVI